MKKTLCVMLAFSLIIFTFSADACAEEMDLSAQAYVLYCVENDTILLEKNAQQRMKVASTTKIMTALLTLEQSLVEDTPVQFEKSMIAEGSSMYLKVGDTIRLSDLAVGMMMASGNDAANAAAIKIAGSLSQFAQLMNKRAKEYNMADTHFVTPSGLDDENHYSTALDMAYLMKHALRNEQFCNIVKNTSMTVDFLTPQKQVTYENHNRLLKLYEYCIGGKTGYTNSAGRCLVTAARRDGLTLVCVTLNAPSDWNDHIAMYDYGFERYCSVDTNDSDNVFSANVVGGDCDNLQLVCSDSDTMVIDVAERDKVSRTVYIPPFLYAPIREGDYIGEVVYTLDGEILAQNPLYALQDVNVVKRSKLWLLFDRLIKN